MPWHVHGSQGTGPFEASGMGNTPAPAELRPNETVGRHSLSVREGAEGVERSCGTAFKNVGKTVAKGSAVVAGAILYVPSVVAGTVIMGSCLTAAVVAGAALGLVAGFLGAFARKGQPSAKAVFAGVFAFITVATCIGRSPIAISLIAGEKLLKFGDMLDQKTLLKNRKLIFKDFITLLEAIDKVNKAARSRKSELAGGNPRPLTKSWNYSTAQ